MRAEFWETGRNYSSTSYSPLDIFKFWITRAWTNLLSDGAGQMQSSLLERGSLLSFLTLVVTETPTVRPPMAGLTYEQSVRSFIPRFLWPDKPRASLPDEILAIYYGVQTTESVDVTAIGLGRISEAWANFGWLGICLAGAVMGLILHIPTRLSDGFSPSDLRYLLALPFVPFGMNLENSLGYAVNGIALSVVFSLACLWLVSRPANRL